MTDKQLERLCEALERIAKALELSNIQNAFQPAVLPGANPAPPVTYPAPGYTCYSCGHWVPAGNYHICGNTAPKITWGNNISGSNPT